MTLFMDVFASSGQRFANTERHDPYRNFNFSVDFNTNYGSIKTGWNAVTGVKLRHDYKEYREGGNNGVPDQIHAETRYEPIVMRRGMSEDTDILNLISKAGGGQGIGIRKKDKFDVTIKVKDRNRAIVKSFKLLDCWITAYEMGDLNAQGAEILFDQITLSFTGVDWSSYTR